MLELVAFDPEAAPGERLRVWDRIDGDLVERVVEGERSPCTVLDPPARSLVRQMLPPATQGRRRPSATLFQADQQAEHRKFGVRSGVLVRGELLEREDLLHDQPPSNEGTTTHDAAAPREATCLEAPRQRGLRSFKPFVAPGPRTPLWDLGPMANAR
ncbi:hypothetical protein WMF37_21890 [Sorangium sp. So ce291]|uniref:hypothetical protein n=1 Tax=Sorangium sp. So ce291 TaxID=3133294 RepID=UPI003F6024C6